MDSCLTGKTMEAKKSFVRVSSRVKHQSFKQLPVILHNQYSWMNQERSRCAINIHTKHGVQLVPWRGVINITPRLMDSPRNTNPSPTMSQSWIAVSERARSHVDIRDRTYRHHGQAAWKSANALDKRVVSELDKNHVRDRNKVNVSQFPRLSGYNFRNTNGQHHGLVTSPRLRFEMRDEKWRNKSPSKLESQLPFRVIKINGDVSIINGHEYRGASTDIDQRISFPVLSADGRRVIVRRVTRPLQCEEQVPYRPIHHPIGPKPGIPRLMPLEPKRHASVDKYLEYVDTLHLDNRETILNREMDEDYTTENAHTRLLDSVMGVNKPESESDI